VADASRKHHYSNGYYPSRHGGNVRCRRPQDCGILRNVRSTTRKPYASRCLRCITGRSAEGEALLLNASASEQLRSQVFVVANPSDPHKPWVSASGSRVALLQSRIQQDPALSDVEASTISVALPDFLLAVPRNDPRCTSLPLERHSIRPGATHCAPTLYPGTLRVINQRCSRSSEKTHFTGL